MKWSIKLTAVMLFMLPGVLFAQKRWTANEAADSIQSMRNEARKLYNKEKPSGQELQQSIRLLHNAIALGDRDSVKMLGEGSLYLKRRKSDVARELVYAYVLAGRYDEAIDALKMQFDESTSFFMLETVADSSFAGIRKDPRFTAMIDKYKARLALWNGAAFKTSYRPVLTEEEKIGGLSLFWSQARANFAYFDKLPADWNQTYLNFIPQVLAAKTTLEYYRVLQKFCAQLHDGHSNVYLPKELVKEVSSKPPLKTELIEGRVFITAVYNDSLSHIGIVPGLEIIKVSHIPVREYAETYVKPLQGAATPQDMEQRLYMYQLLAGPAAQPVELDVRERNGKIKHLSVARSGYPKPKPVPAMEYREIGHIGYLCINNFEDRNIVHQFDSLYTRIALTNGLIIDIRNNGGGDSSLGEELLARLTDKPFPLFAYKFVRYDSRGGEPYWTDQPLAVGQPNKQLYYKKPVTLLVSAMTYSAAEDFTVAFDYMKRGKLIGQTTGGSTGQPVFFSLPGGGSARICGKRETYPDGKEFVDTGIVPDIQISKTISDLYNGTDSVLNKAVAMLKE